jgi:hypothetical protein
MRNPDCMAFFHWGLEKMLSATLANPTLFWGVVGFAGAAVATIGLKVLKYITADADMVRKPARLAQKTDEVHFGDVVVVHRHF